MATGLDALDNHPVGARRLRPPRLLDRAALVQPNAAGPAPRLAPEGHDDVGLRRRLEPVAPGEREQHVDRERAPGQCPRRRQLAPDRSGAADRDRPQASGLGDRRRQLVPADPAAHPGLDDGKLNP